MTTDLSLSSIQRLLEICDRATEGPWKIIPAETTDTGHTWSVGIDGPHDVMLWTSKLGNEGMPSPDDGVFCAAARTALSDALREIQRCHERLEIGFAYRADKSTGEMVRVPCDGMPDGIECRDDTIKIQDGSIEALHGRIDALEVERDSNRERIAALEAALKPFAEQADCWDGDADSDPITTCNGDGDCASLDFTIADLRKARAVLSGGNGE